MITKQLNHNLKISLISAMGTNRVIGNNGKMPWHLPDELQYFIDKTRDHHVLLVRRTFQSYKQIMRDHKVIVVTRKQDYDGAYVEVVSSVVKGILIVGKQKSKSFILWVG